MRIRHLGIVVQDLEQTAEFYENVLGFRRLGDAGPRATSRARPST